MADSYHRSFFLKGSAGRIEALLWTVSEKRPTSAAVVCHPHPLYGGTMHNKVVYQAAKALHEAGMPVLRFNFRGTGLSEGEHENGLGERDDVRTAIDYLAHEFPGATLLVAGFSFGAWVGLRVGCEDPRVTRLIGIGIPVAQKDMRFMRNCEQPKLFISGSQDEYGPLEKVEEVFAIMQDPKRLRIVAGVDHFFTGKLPKVGEEITTWLKEFPR